MRKLVAWLALLVVFAGMGVPALAGVGISPMYINVTDMDINLTFDGTTAKCKSTIQGLSGTTNITATFTLQRKETNGSYTTLKTWANQSVSGTVLRFSNTYSVASGYTFRLNVSATVTRNGVSETISDWVENKP